MGTSPCWNCHTEVDDTETQCPECGTTIDGEGSPVLASDRLGKAKKWEPMR